MLSSALPAGRPALSITAKYQRLLLEALEHLGRPNQRPDLNPCSAIKLKQLGVMEASTLFSWCVSGLLVLIGVAHEVMCWEPKCPSRRIGVFDLEPGSVCVGLREQMEILICRCGLEMVK